MHTYVATVWLQPYSLHVCNFIINTANAGVDTVTLWLACHHFSIDALEFDIIDRRLLSLSFVTINLIS